MSPKAEGTKISFASKDLEDLALEYNVDVNPHTGQTTARVTCPLTPGRSEFGPALTFQYNSSAGNSVYGMGWSIGGVETINVHTRRSLPRYDGQDGYALNGTDELVPALQKTGGAWEQPVQENGPYWVYYYRRKIETDYTRFEKWVDKRDGRIHWRTRDRKNVLSIYGLGAGGGTRIADPDQPDHLFSWLLEARYDPQGNAIFFEYERDLKANLDANSPVERERILRASSFAQRYLKRIRYGNTEPLQPDQEVPASNRWPFQVVFDFGDHAGDPLPGTQPDRPWPMREDPFSTHRPGFEVRTYRLCRRVLLFHQFEALGATPVIVGALRFSHDEDAAGSMLRQMDYEGFRHDRETGAFARRGLPPLTFEYSSARMEGSFVPVPEESRTDVPSGLGSRHRWVDLLGEGLSGILLETNGAWYYKANTGGGSFGPQQRIPETPSQQVGSYTLADFDGDGNQNVLTLGGYQAGYYEYDRDRERWNGFQAFPSSPGLDSKVSPEWLDLTGDGLTDMIISQQDRFTWYPSKGKEGFGSPSERSKPFSNGTSQVQQISDEPDRHLFFADMNGDGSPDQVRIDNGRVEYWPQIGHGRFDAGVVMENPPGFDFEDQFDPRRIRLVDLDGNGCADILYIGRGEIRCWVNGSGNRWVEKSGLAGLPFIDKLSSAQVLDFLGDGTPCLVWSSAAMNQAVSPLQYLKLTDGVKPRLLARVDNSMGKVVKLAYASSSSHYLRDQTNGRRWKSKLPTHVTVVEAKEVIDEIGGTALTSRYEYRDGCFDSLEREFRGFGEVDQYDSEIPDTKRGPADIIFIAPACVRTWYHQGKAGGDEEREEQFYDRDAGQPRLPLLTFERFLDSEGKTLNAGFKALEGQVLRQEVYGIKRDGTRETDPYQVVQSAYRIRQLQPGRGEIKPCFAFYESELLTCRYEEAPGDPRVTHHFALEFDTFGNITRECEAAYPRRAGIVDTNASQKQTILTARDSAFLHIDDVFRYEAIIPLQTKEFELGRVNPGPNGLFQFASLRQEVETALSGPLPFSEPFPPAGTSPKARLLVWNRCYYWNDDRTRELPFGAVGDRTLLHHKENACFDSRFLLDTFGGLADEHALGADGHYVPADGYWWQQDPVQRYLPFGQFSLLSEEENSDGGITRYTYDAPYYLTLTGVRDSVGNETTAVTDYHLLAPRRIIDPNDNVAEAQYDPLGVVVLMTSYGDVLGPGRQALPLGYGALADYVEQGDPVFATVLAEPGRFVQTLRQFLYYELDTWKADHAPPRSIDLIRESLLHDGRGGMKPESGIQLILTYRDGFGRTLQSKRKVEAGPAVKRDGSGAVVLDLQGLPEEEFSDERWLVSGHRVYNAKQLIIREYEPFFSTTADFESGAALRSYGVSTLTRFDALGRERRKDLPNGAYTRAEITPWEIRHYDPNDTAADSMYTAGRGSLPDSDPEKKALLKTLAHADTPLISQLDPLGREARKVEKEARGSERLTIYSYDAAGKVVEITDPRGLTAFRYSHDMLGRVHYRRGVDSGETWTCLDSFHKPAHEWDSRGVHKRIVYDRLRRPAAVFVKGALGLDQMTERFFYGEQLADSRLRNSRGRLATHLDQAGRLDLNQFDADGKPLGSVRKLLSDYKSEPDWGNPSGAAFEAQPYETSWEYDGLGRIIRQRLADGTSRFLEYCPSGGIRRMTVSSDDGELDHAEVLRAAEYNARGQRTGTVLGNGVSVAHRYDPDTFRLARVTAEREPQRPGARGQTLQDIEYTYDAAGNVIRFIDHVQEPASSANLLQGLTVSPEADFTYDALYQLVEARGRVHQALLPHDYLPGAAGAFMGSRHLHLNNGQAVERYSRTYQYDPSGNIKSLHHQGATRSWTNPMWTSAGSNRSLPMRDPDGAPVSDGESRFDGNGNTLYLPHLARVEWNYRNAIGRAVRIDRSAGGRPDDAEYYVYAGDGLRIRKVTERLVNGEVEITEKIYLEGLEVKRIRRGGETRLERRTVQIGDDRERFAFLHQWSVDLLARETDDTGQKRFHYQISNHLGSGLLEVDGRGMVISYEEYFPYGGTAFVAGDGLRDIRLKDYRYSAKECDDATGLYYYEYRYYAPWIGNWLSPDPLGPEDSTNLYLFSRNNPVTFIDMEGLLPASPARKKEEEEKPPFPYLSLLSEQLTLHPEQYLLTKSPPEEGEENADAGARESLPGGVSTPPEIVPQTYEEWALDAGIPRNEYGEFVFTGGAYGSEESPALLLAELKQLAIQTVVFAAAAVVAGLFVVGLSTGISESMAAGATLGEAVFIEAFAFLVSLAFAEVAGSALKQAGFSEGTVFAGELLTGILGGVWAYGLIRSTAAASARGSALTLLDDGEELVLESEFIDLRKIGSLLEPSPEEVPGNFIYASEDAVLRALSERISGKKEFGALTYENLRSLANPNRTADELAEDLSRYDFAEIVHNEISQGRLSLRILSPKEWAAHGLPSGNISAAHGEGVLFLRLPEYPEIGLNLVIHEGIHGVFRSLLRPQGLRMNLLREEFIAHQAEALFLRELGAGALPPPYRLELYLQRIYRAELGERFRIFPLYNEVTGFHATFGR